MLISVIHLVAFNVTFRMLLKGLLITIIILTEIPFRVSGVVATRDFTRITTCDHVTTTSVTVRTQTQCAMACGGLDWCKSYSVTTTTPRLCHLHRVYLKAGVCKGHYKHYNDMNNPCFHGGRFNVHKRTCTCYGGYIGDHCERLMQDCSEGYRSHHYKRWDRGNYLCRPKGAPKPIKLYCSMEYGGRTFILNQTAGTENFTRTWEEYRTGFGSLSGDHWLGNDNIHYITNGRKHYLVAEVWTPGDSYYTILGQQFYNDFLIGPEVDNYKMTFSSNYYSRKWAIGPEKCLVNATLFSTPDVDHSSGAVGLTRSGFWHANPPECNPTGYLKTSDTSWGGDRTDVFWEYGIDGEAVNRIQLYLTFGARVHH